MAPNKDDIRVSTDALRTDAGVWDAQAAQMAKVSKTANGLRMSQLEAGIFAVFHIAYKDAVNQVADRLAEGAQRMPDIATTLRAAATTYDTEEQEHIHEIRNLY